MLLLLLCQANIVLPEKGGTELLQLAINSSKGETVEAAMRHLPATAADAMRSMPGLLEPGVACKLLVTAAAGRSKQHAQALLCMLKLAYIKQRVDAAAVEAVLKAMLNKQLINRATFDMRLQCVLRLCKLPAAKQLSSKAVFALAQAAINCAPQGTEVQLDLQAANALIGLPAAQQLTQAAVTELLRAAVRCDGVTCIRMLCKLPAAQSFGEAAVARVLRAALDCGGFNCVGVLCKLGSAQQLSSDAVTQLLSAAVCCSSDGCTEQLCKLPAAQQCGSTAVAAGS
jgi:hypothetical protein